MQLIIQNIIRFILLVLVQVFVLDNIQLNGYLNPMIYILFIIALPVHISRNITLLLAFVLGMLIDMFSNTMGIHTFATVLLAFCRVPVMKMFLVYGDLLNKTPTPHFFGVAPYLKYLIVLVFIHHFSIFMIDAFTLYAVGMVILKMLASIGLSILIIIGIQSIPIRES